MPSDVTFSEKPLINLHGDDLTAIFVDGPNLNYAARSMNNFRIDFNKLRRGFEVGCRLQAARYFTCTKEGPDGADLMRFLSMIERNGWYVETRPCQQILDEATKEVRTKDNIDPNIIVSMVELAFVSQMQHFVLFSGDADFIEAVAAVQRRGVRVTIVSTSGRNGFTRTVSSDLLAQADAFVDLQDLAPYIARDNGGPS